MVPKAPVNEDRHFFVLNDNVWFARQGRDMQSNTKAVVA
jgi:hypothetical protein